MATEIVDNHHNVQHGVLETFVDRGQLRKLAVPTVLPSGKREPDLKLDHPHQLAAMHSLIRFANIGCGYTRVKAIRRGVGVSASMMPAAAIATRIG